MTETASKILATKAHGSYGTTVNTTVIDKPMLVGIEAGEAFPTSIKLTMAVSLVKNMA